MVDIQGGQGGQFESINKKDNTMKREYEKILRRDDGSRVKIKVRLPGEYNGDIDYPTEVHTCAKRKRTWVPTFDRDDYIYRGMSTEEQDAFKYDSQFKSVSSDELLAAKMELWETFMPSI